MRRPAVADATAEPRARRIGAGGGRRAALHEGEAPEAEPDDREQTDADVDARSGTPFFGMPPASSPENVCATGFPVVTCGACA